MRKGALVLVAGLLFAASAQAMTLGKPIDRRWLARHLTALGLAQAAAVQYWGGSPCGGSVTIAYAATSSEPTDTTDGVSPSTPLWAWVTFQTPSGPDDFTEPPVSYTGCSITINQDIWTPVERTWDFPDFCGLIVHEYGHFFGHPDLASDPPASITYPYIGTLNEHVGPCVARYRLSRLLVVRPRLYPQLAVAGRHRAR